MGGIIGALVSCVVLQLPNAEGTRGFAWLFHGIGFTVVAVSALGMVAHLCCAGALHPQEAPRGSTIDEHTPRGSNEPPLTPLRVSRVSSGYTHKLQNHWPLWVV